MSIAIDGPSASGKTTVARLLAGKLGYRYLDTGLLYRAVAWRILREKIDPGNEAGISRLCRGKIVSLEKNNLGFRIWVETDGGKEEARRMDVTADLKTPELSAVSSIISKYRAVRENLMNLQREVGKEEKVILVGRDIGTQILPEAPLKFFMDASIETRGKRRYEELVKKGYDVELKKTIQEMSQRDKQDSEREIAPMKMARDAIRVDTTLLSLEEVVDQMLKKIKNPGKKGGTQIETVAG